ncbi:MAG: DUF418 domain-containing protein [Bryobacteraceae bacterium]
MPESEIPDEIQPDPPEEIALEPEPIPLTPVARQERIAAMDVLRGIAVFGIFLINMPLYLAPSAGFFDWQENALWSGAADRLATLFIYIFAQGKFYTLFSFLFGLGFGVQMLRAEERNSPNFLSTYRRRLFVLLAIGTLHFTLIWWGDVLHVYALLGFLLILFRKRTDKTLLIWAACLTFVPFVLAVGGTAFEKLTDKEPVAEKEKKRKERKEKNEKRIADDLRLKSTGTIPEILKLRLQRDARQLGGEAAWSTELFTSFLLGLWASRRGILQGPSLYRPLLTRLAYVALPLGLAFSSVDLIYGYFHPAEEWPLWRVHSSLIREFIARPAMAFGYAAVLLLIGIKEWMSPFAAVGRMALTNYLLHSLVFTTIANSYGLGLYGKIHPVQGLALCFAFYALQLPFSVWWLRNYNYGPVEWLWRSFTYGVRQPWSKITA